MSGSLVLGRAAGTGLTGEYFTSTNFTGTKTTRVDATVNFDWGTNSPGFGGLGSNNFSIRWSGQLEPLYNDTYTFYVTADEGATLWVNDRLIVSRLYYATPAQMGGQISLKAGQRVNIRLEYFEKNNNASVRLEWTSASQMREVVPQSQLYTNMMPAERGSILREHWSNLSGTAITNLTAYTNYPAKPDSREMFLSFECLQPNWTTNVGTRLSGYVMPQTNGVFKFAVAASDKAELWMSTDTNPANNQLIAFVTNATAFRDWSNNVSQVSTGRTLVAWQKYYIELRHKAGANSNHYSVAWQPPGATQFSVIGADYLIPVGLNNSLPAQTNIFNTLAQSHPRLLATAERFAWLKQQVATNPAGQPALWYTSIYNSASNLFNLTANPPVVYNQDVRGTILDQSRAVQDRIYKLGLAWKISGDTNFAERAWTELNAAGNFPDWHPPHFLDTAEMTHGFAIAYDWFYEYWSASRKNFILTNITTKGLTAGLKEFTNNVSWTRSTANNWNMVCNGGLTLGALAVGTDAETTAELMLSKTIPSQAPVMQHFTADNGLWYEGPGYWDYTCDYNYRMLAGLQSALGTDFGLSATNGLNNAGLFAILNTSANKRNFNYADAGGAGVSGGSQMFWWARRFDMPAYARYERTNNNADAMSALLWDGRGGDPVSENIGTDVLFLGPSATPFNPQHVGVFRSSWGDLSETFLAFKGGQMGADHGDLDAGTFALEALGSRWAMELGSDDYALPGYFDFNPASATNRWDYYRMRAEGQNTLVINPGNGPDTALGPVAPVITFQSKTGVRALSVMDLTPVETNITRAWRGFQMFGPQRKQVLIQDEITSTNANVWWFMHYQRSSTQVTLSADSNSVMMTQGTNRLWGKILSGGGTFQIMDARPLPTSPDPAGQDLNTNYQKLAIHLTGVTNTTIAVWFVPLTPGQNPPVVAPTLVPLAQWQIPETNSPVAIDGYFTTPENAVTNINLTTLVSETSMPVSNLVYTVTGATNGTVTLLADGVTAQFTPATNFYGTGQFLYSARDSASNTASAAAVITILPAAWYWDTSTMTGLQPASGTWDGATTSWSVATNGSNPLLPWPPLGNDAMFIGAGGAYTVTVNSTQQVNQISTTNGVWTFTGGALKHASGPMTITANAETTLNLPLIADTDLTKLGTNRLTLGAPVSISGNVNVPAGTLRIAASNALPVIADLIVGSPNGTAGNLELNASQTLATLNFQSISSATNLINIGPSNTLAISSTNTGIAFGFGNFGSTIGSLTATTRVAFVRGGSLIVAATNGSFSLEPSGTNSASGTPPTIGFLDFSGLSNLTANVSTFTAAVNGGRPNNVSGQFTMNLATNNNITASNFIFAASGYYSGSATNTLGSSNSFSAENMLFFGGRMSGTMSFQASTRSNLTIRGMSGGTGRANLYIADQVNLTGLGSGPGGSSVCSGTLNLGGATVDARLDQLMLGIAASSVSQYGSAVGTLIFGGSNSVVDVNNVYLGYAVSNSASTTTFNSPTHSGTLSMIGGTLVVNSNLFLGYSADDSLGNTQNVTGVINFNGGTATFAGGVYLGYATNTIGAVAGLLNLTNGIFNVNGSILSSGITATGTVNLAGATLNLNGNQFGSATKSVNLVASSGNLQNVGEINAGSPLVKSGNGTLVLSGTNAYTGVTTINAGELLGVTGSSASNSAVTALAGATNGVLVLAGGGQWVCGALTASAGSYLDFNFTNTTIGNATAPLKVLGNLSCTNPTVIVRTATSITNGQYTLIEYASLSGTVISNVTFVPALSARLKYTIVTNAVRSTLDIVILSTNNDGALSWAVGNGNWDINTSTNWQSGGFGGYYYQDGMSVILDDTASGASPVLITNAVTVSPSILTVNLTGKNYTISGNAIAGGGLLTKTGIGSLTLAGANSYTGATTVSGGTLLVNGNSSASTSTVTVFTNAIFGGTGILGGNVILNGGGNLAPGGVNAVGMLTLASSLTLNSGDLLFDMANASGGTNDLVVVGGTLTQNGVNTIFLTGGTPAGDYTLMTYAAAGGPGTFVLAAAYPNASLVVNPTSLVLRVGAGGSLFGLTWKGNISGTWDSVALNWTNEITATNFNPGDNVIFDDTLANNPIITNATPGATVSPGAVMFNNSLANYTIAAAIGGTGSLVKSGIATVTLAGANTYSGNTTVSAGALVVGDGGAINSPNATLNVGPDVNRATNMLAAGGAITIQTLLASNVVCGGPTNSIFSFSGGTLTTSNNSGLAASILLASNASFNVNGNWNLNGGTNIFSNVGTNPNAAGTVYVPNAANSVQVNVNSNAVWWHAIPANSQATNGLNLQIANGNATNNAFTVNGGLVSNVNIFFVGSGSGSVSNQLIITNGGQFILGAAVTYSAMNGSYGSIIVGGTNGDGRRAKLDLGRNTGDRRLYLANGNTATTGNRLLVDSGGVLTNAGIQISVGSGNGAIITNGGQAYFIGGVAVGRNGGNTNYFIVGGFDGSGSNSYVSGTALDIGGSGNGGSPGGGTNNWVLVDQGGIMKMAAINIAGSGKDYNSFSNRLLIANGGQMFSTGASIVGAITNGVNNWAYVGGNFGPTNSTWNLGNQTLTIGAANINQTTTNNYVLLDNNGLMKNVSSVILGGVNSKVIFNGGTLAAGTNGNLINTNSTAFNAASYVQTGGANIDTAGFTVTNVAAMIEDPSSAGGGLTKLGSGTLTLAGNNSYTGPTLVSAGTLRLLQPTLASNSTVTVAVGAVLNLGFANTNQVSALVLGGVSQSVGVYNSTTATPYITGTGSLLVARPTISGSTTLTNFITTYGAASAAQSFLVTGVYLMGDITGTAAPGYEISTNSSMGYGSTATIAALGGNASGTMYIRLSAAALAGSYNTASIIVLTSPGSASITNSSTVGGNVVSQAMPVLTVNPTAITYGQTLTNSSLAGSLATNANNNTQVAGSYAFASPAIVPNAGIKNVTVNFIPNDTANYTSATTNVNVVVNPAALVITASNLNKAFGTTLTFAGTEFTSSGLVNGDTVTSVTLGSAGAVSTAPLGVYAITATNVLGSGLTNYSITYSDGQLTVVADFWRGYNNGTWDNSTLNWTNLNPVIPFANNDAVFFDDTLVGNPTISNATPGSVVSPSSVTFSNSVTCYTISAVIGGPGALTKLGTATTTFSGTNTYSGNTLVSAGTLVVTNGGAINSPNATLNIGSGTTVATNTLASGGAITIKTLLATNVVCGGPNNSIFSFSGGTLTTSNNSGLAASILLASNASFNVNGNWNLNGGTNIFSNVATNGGAAATLTFGNAANNLQVNVNSNAVWWHAIPANSRATNALILQIGAGNATNNVFTVNGGSLLVTNATGNSAPVNIGNNIGSVGNQLAILNGGQVFTKNSYPVNQYGTGGLNLQGVNNSVIVAGTNAAGLKAMWNLNTDRFNIGSASQWSNNWVRVDDGGVVTNTSLFLYSLKGVLFITNGGQVYASGLSLGRGGLNNTIIVSGTNGGGENALLSFYSGNAIIGGGSVSSSNPGTNNTLRVDAGGLMTNVGALYIGGGTSSFDSNCIGNSVIITNGGQTFNTAVNIGNLPGCNSNSASIGGGAVGSLWKFNNTALNIGNNASGTNNFVTLFAGGVLTNVSSVILGGVNSRIYFNGGTLAAGTNGNLINTNSGAINAAIYVLAGGTVFDSLGFSVTNRLPLLQDPNSIGGGLTKLGTGTLTLVSTNNYSGDTTVSAGTLRIIQPTIATNSTVTVASGAVLNLGFAGTNQVASFVTNNVSLPSGVYNSTTAAPFITGTGSLLVVNPGGGSKMLLNFSINVQPSVSPKIANGNISSDHVISDKYLALTWPLDHLGYRLIVQTNNLAYGISLNTNDWMTVPNSTLTNQMLLPINPATPALYYRLVTP